MMKIVIDTREQRPYSFEIPSEVGTVPVGDYSIQGLENRVAIERKELNDLIGCLTTGRDRFERELHKGRTLDHFALVVEGALSDIVKGRYRSHMESKAAMQSLMAFSVRYRLLLGSPGGGGKASRKTPGMGRGTVRKAIRARIRGNPCLTMPWGKIVENHRYCLLGLWGI